VAAGLLSGLLAQLTGEIGELVQGGIDADVGELGLDYLQVKALDVGEMRRIHPVAWSHPSRGVPGR
jgi:hypothetical protein